MINIPLPLTTTTLRKRLHRSINLHLILILSLLNTIKTLHPRHSALMVAFLLASRALPPVLADADALEAFGAAPPAVVDAAFFAPGFFVSFFLADAGPGHVFLVEVA
jgi:hypothetical protein